MEGPYLNELKVARNGYAFRNRRLETEYRTYRVNRERYSLRVQVLLGVLLVCSIMLMDTLLLDPEFATQAILVRAVVMLPPLLALAALTWSRDLQRYVQPLGILSALGVGLASLALGVLSARYDQPRVFAGYQVIIVFIYFFLGLRVPVAIATATTLVFAYLATAVTVSAPLVSTAYNTLYLVFLNIICAVGALQMDRSRRNEFLEERILKYRANHDALTELPNRRAFDDVLASHWETALQTRRSLALLILDIDHFKDYNDEYGHQAGDRAIREVACILQNELKRPQDFAGRYGGEEFVVLLFDATRHFATQLAERIRQQVVEKNIEHKKSASGSCVSVSIGLTWLLPNKSSRSAKGFVQSADQALYAAKQQGRNCVVDADDSEATTTTGVFRVVQVADRQAPVISGSRTG